jgi:hypothetical protein
MLLWAPPLAQESGEGIPIDIEAKAARHEGKQQWGGGGVWQEVLEKKTNSKACEKQIKNYSPTRVLNFSDKGPINKHGSNWAFNISLEISWNLDTKSGFVFSIWNYELRIVAKRMVSNQIYNLTPKH